MLISGSDTTQLFDVLRQVDTLTRSDTIVRTGDPVTLSASVRHGRICDWNLSSVPQESARSGVKIGTNDESLEDLFAQFEQIQPDLGFSVACMLSADPDLTWDCQVKTTWAILDTDVPFVVKQGKPDFHIEAFLLTEKEYQICTGSRLGLYDEVSQMIYSIQPVAFSPIAKLLDAEAAFKALDSMPPLGTALMLAARLGKLKDLQLIYRDGTSKVKRLVGIAGPRFVKTSQADFFKDVYGECAKIGVCHIHQWTVTDDLSTVTIDLDFQGETGYQPCIVARTSDIPGTSYAVSAYVRVADGGEILLKKNTAYHSARFPKKGGVPSLFDGIEDAFLAFRSKLRKIATKNVLYDPAMLQAIFGIIGKKRSQSVGGIRPGVYRGDELFETILKSTYCEMPKKQAEILASLYSDVLDQIANDKEDADDTDVEQ